MFHQGLKVRELTRNHEEERIFMEHESDKEIKSSWNLFQVMVMPPTNWQKTRNIPNGGNRRYLEIKRFQERIE